MGYIVSIDTGGTMTDTFVVDERGRFYIGKAQTTPENETIGFLNSLRDAFKRANIPFEEGVKAIEIVIYAGTTLINKLLTRKLDGPVGVIVTAGFEDVLRFGRGVQSYLDYPYKERLHAVSHHYDEPLVPLHMIKGVRERIDFMGSEFIPLYERDVIDAVEYFLKHNVRAICVCFLFSYRNPQHELEAEAIIKEELSKRGVDIPVFLSSRHNPIRGELPRLNTLLVEVTCARGLKEQVKIMRNSLKNLGAKGEIRIITSYGTSISPDSEWLVSALISGPVGGMIGSKYVAELLGLKNVACTDVGGTSFDVGLITEGHYTVTTEPRIARLLLTIPAIVMDSIGAGCGTYIRLDPATDKVLLGPDSAGAKIGTCYPEAGLETPTITDCNLLLGYLNPDYFLGGDVKLDPQRARSYVERVIARRLSLPVEKASFGIYELVNQIMKDYLYAQILGLGFAPENYVLISYGGGGPLHVAGYTEGLNFQDILIPTWAPAFSAFGCACADFAVRFDESVDLILEPDFSNSDFVFAYLSMAWGRLRERIRDEFRRSGLDEEKIIFVPYVRMQYRGMLDDLEVNASGINSGEDMTKLSERFDILFEKIFARAAKSKEAGYIITKAQMIGTYPTVKPVIPEEKEVPFKIESAMKGRRKIYWKDEWMEAFLYEMDLLKPGAEIKGPAIIEAPATTFFIPPGYFSYLDRYRIFHLRRE
jgi:N-methylhydantoinase A/acetone carboxylase beta subunit